MSHQEMHLVMSADSGYLDFLLISLDSAFRNASCHTHAHVLSTDFSERERDPVLRLADFHGAGVDFHQTARRDHESLPNLLHLSLNTYLRIYAAEELIACDRLLYLDCDLIVRRDLAALWTTDLHGCPLGAAPMLNAPYGIDFIRSHKLTPRHRYFNAGVLLIDAEAWRQEGYCDQLFRWLSENRNTLTFADQDGLNAIFAGKTCSLSPAWNCEARLFIERQFPKSRDIDKIIEATAEPAVIHFTGPLKPWGEHGYCPRREEFWRNVDEVSAITARPMNVYRFKNRLADSLRNQASLARVHASHNVRRLFKKSSSQHGQRRPR